MFLSNSLCGLGNFSKTVPDKQINREIGKRRIPIEHVNGKLKTFKILLSMIAIGVNAWVYALI